MNGRGANIYAIKPFLPVEEEVVGEKRKVDKQLQATDGKSLDQGSQVFQNELEEGRAETVEERPSTTLYARMKTLLLSTIGTTVLARNFYGAYRQVTLPLLKFSIHAHQTPLFERLALQALQITVQASKKKSIRYLPGYFSGVLRAIIDEILFADAFMDYTVPVESIGSYV